MRSALFLCKSTPAIHIMFCDTLSHNVWLVGLFIGHHVQHLSTHPRLIPLTSCQYIYIWHSPKVRTIKFQIEGGTTTVRNFFSIIPTLLVCCVCIVFTFLRVLFYCLRLTLSFGWAPAKLIPALCWIRLNF